MGVVKLDKEVAAEGDVAIYRGKGPGFWGVTKNGLTFSPARSLKVWNHSPTGFAWGYSGSGPAQLALALLLDVLDNDDRAVRLHQRFKSRVIARLPMDDPWELTSEQIMEHVKQLEAECDD